MSPKGQLITFELFSGLCGWVWIGGGIATVIFAALALFADWSWWNVLYAVIVSGIAKWLARGFLDNKRRVLFEQALVEQGFSQQDAAKKWMEEYGKGRL